jgi:hypothetical protein
MGDIHDSPTLIASESGLDALSDAVHRVAEYSGSHALALR